MRRCRGMKNLVSWMVLEMILGIWLFISPFVMGYKEFVGVALNSMLLGAVVVLLGLGVSLQEFHERENLSNSDQALHMSSTSKS
jgi:hypothetical protein